MLFLSIIFRWAIRAVVRAVLLVLLWLSILLIVPSLLITAALAGALTATVWLRFVLR